VLAPPLGVVLAGGAASRLPGKPLLELHGRPLISYPLAALGEVFEEVVVVAKAPLLGLPTWIEPAEPQHPACGILHALRNAGGRAVLVCAADMPLIDAGELRAILAARGAGDALAVVPRAGGRPQPLCALYEPLAARVLEAGMSAAMTRLVEDLGARVVDRCADPYANINTPIELARANRT